MSTSTIARSYNVAPLHRNAVGPGNHLSSHILRTSDAPVGKAWQQGLVRHTSNLNLSPPIRNNVYTTASLAAYDVLSGGFAQRCASLTGTPKDSARLSDYLALFGVPKDIAGRFDAAPRKAITKAQMAHLITQLERDIPAARRAADRQYALGEINSSTHLRTASAMDLMSTTLKDLKAMNQVFTVHHAGSVDLDLAGQLPEGTQQQWRPR